MKLPLLTTDPLAIYLRDHHAGSTFGVELARRARDQNLGSEFGEFLAQLATEIESDREALEAIMRDLGVGADPVKVSVAWAAERVGRLKFNGRLVGYAPLSRVLELEGLIAGVSGKLALWRALQQLRGSEPRLAGHALEHLAERAESQLGRLHEQHRVAVLAVGSDRA
jgi:hypothetical protein